MSLELINERELLKEITMHERSINKVLSEIEKLRSNVSDQERLRVVRHGKGYQYFVRKKGSDTNGKYIAKKEIEKAVTMAQIEYDERLLNALQEAKKLLEKCMTAGLANPFDTVLEMMPQGKRKLVRPHYISDDSFINNWKGQEYESLPFKEDFPEYYTKGGLRVRSKSEILIADILDEMSIPFLYEKPLILNKRTVHPDFTLLNIKRRKEVYWEHFGMMDDREYRDDALLKIREYEANGLYQYDSVVWTFESGKYPINIKEIRNMVINIGELLGYL